MPPQGQSQGSQPSQTQTHVNEDGQSINKFLLTRYVEGASIEEVQDEWDGFVVTQVNTDGPNLQTLDEIMAQSQDAGFNSGGQAGGGNIPAGADEETVG